MAYIVSDVIGCKVTQEGNVKVDGKWYILEIGTYKATIMNSTLNTLCISEKWYLIQSNLLKSNTFFADPKGPIRIFSQALIPLM